MSGITYRGLEIANNFPVGVTFPLTQTIDGSVNATCSGTVDCDNFPVLYDATGTVDANSSTIDCNQSNVTCLGDGGTAIAQNGSNQAEIEIDSGTLSLTTTATAIDSMSGSDITLANTEYNVTFASGTRGILLCLRNPAVSFRIATSTGYVATSTEPFLEVPAGSIWQLNIALDATLTLYFASSSAGQYLQYMILD